MPTPQWKPDSTMLTTKPLCCLKTITKKSLKGDIHTVIGYEKCIKTPQETRNAKIILYI